MCIRAGLILVHDLTNRKSYKNIGLWIKEVIGSDSFKWKVRSQARLHQQRSPSRHVVSSHPRRDVL
jgi:hypothetical protein